MKKIIGALLLMTVCLTAFSGCGLGKKAMETATRASSKALDYDKIIEDFVPDNFNTEELSVGEKHKHRASVWVSNGLASDANVYSSNENVATISETGTVTAVGPGVAYVFIVTFGGMYEVTEYTVY